MSYVTASIDQVGASPINIQWKVVRGDTATLKIEFLEDDEVTPIDISEWTFVSSSYDSAGDTLDELTVEKYTGYVVITALSEITKFWGVGYRNTVLELPFDLEIIIPNDESGAVESEITWTPVIGTIVVLSDITGTAL
jgi:hypothetical protein